MPLAPLQQAGAGGGGGWLTNKNLLVFFAISVFATALRNFMFLIFLLCILIINKYKF
jgi:hypothetical protein